MSLKNPKLLLVSVALVLLSNTVLAQTTSTDNTLGTTGVTAIQSTTNTNYQLTVGGAVKLFHTGNSGLSSPSLYLINTSGSGRKYFLNSDDAGSFRILDSAFATPRFTIYNSGNLGIGTNTDAGYKLDVTGTTRFSADAIINSLTVGKGTGTNNSTNTAVGVSVLSVNTTGYNNTAFGYQSLYSNTEGLGNVAIGSQSMYSTTGVGGTGYQNTAVGQQSLYSNTTGYNNTAIGIQAMFYNTTGFYNTAVGSSALRDNTSGIYNTALGVNAMLKTTTGGYNTAVGSTALNENITGTSNTAIGWQALFANTAINNTAVGRDALTYNTTGVNNTAIGTSALYESGTGYNNTALGTIALQKANLGVANTASGVAALQYNTSGNHNSAFGHYSGNDMVSGEYNVFLGSNSGRGITTGSYNTILGSQVMGLSSSLSNNIIIADGQGNRRINVDATGNVGIGVTSPTEKLHIVGNALITGNITSPGTGSQSEKFGNYATVNANNNSLAMGFNAITLGNESVAIGNNSKAYLNSVSLGSSAQATGYASTIIGMYGNDNGQNYITSIGAANTNPVYFSGGSYLNSGMINIGYNNSSAGNNGTYLIGANLTTDRANQMIIGNGQAGGFLSDIVLGGGLSNELAASYGGVTIRTTDGNGANSAGMPLVFKGGRSTGSASGGGLSFFTTPAGATGSTLNTEIERLRIEPSGTILFNGSAGTTGQVLSSNGTGTAPTWTTLSGAATSSAWGLTGNAGTNPSTNFIGTTDDQPVLFKVNNVNAGKLASTGFVSLGYEANNSNLSSTNTAIGHQALKNITGGADWTTAVGYQAGINTTTGDNNSFIGYSAGRDNVSGRNNTVLGKSALLNSVSGNENTSIGSSALETSTGSYMTAIGSNAGRDQPTSANCNSIIDNNCLFLGAYASRDASVATSTALTNAIAIGYKAKVGASNSLVLGGLGANAVNVGIGTSIPASTLDVKGTTTISDGTIGGTLAAWGTHFQISSNTSTDRLRFVAGKAGADIGFFPNQSNRGFLMNVAGNLLFMGGSGETLGGIGSGNGTNDVILYYATAANNQVEGMRLTNSGSVGIGTATPNANTKLHVAGNIYSNGIIAIGSSIDWTKITGNTDPALNYKLAVNGNAIFERAKVKLNAAWPDYVFKPSYKLPSLNDLEAYLLKNNHLPDVPSAEEVGKNGIDLGDNQTILLKKVEELTLYMIEKDKEVKELQKKTTEQGELIKALQIQVNTSKK